MLLPLPIDLPLLLGLLSLGARRLGLLVPLDLGPLLVLLLPLQPHCLLLPLRSGLIALNSPGPLLLPISVIMPAFPVLLKLSIGDTVIMPRVSVPVMVCVVSSPARVDIKIETRNVIEVGPASVIVMRAIPVAVPEAPPPAVMEVQIHAYTRNSVDVKRIGQHYHRRRSLKYDGRRQGDPHTHTY